MPESKVMEKVSKDIGNMAGMYSLYLVKICQTFLTQLVLLKRLVTLR